MSSLREGPGNASEGLDSASLTSSSGWGVPKIPFFIPLMNPMIKSLLRLGLPMGAMTLITVKGRKSGRPHTTPVGLFEVDGRRFVYGTFGNVNWVKNIRTSGEAVVGRGLSRKTFVTRELGSAESAEVLKRVLTPYLSSRLGSAFLRMGYSLTLNSSMEDYATEASRHPGFELLEPTPARAGWVDGELYPFEDRWVTIDGHRIHYVDEGRRDGPVLLFLHPGPGWSFTYRFHVESLKGDFRCVALDFPGYGLSIAGDGYGYTLMEQAEVLQKFVRKLDLRDIVVWGNDGGGPTGILALADDSERVVGLVMGGTFGWSIKDYPSVGRMLRIFSSSPARFLNRYTNFLAYSSGSRFSLGKRRLTKQEKQHYTKPFADRHTRSRPLKLFASFNDKKTQEALDSALTAFRDKPILIQFGDGDPMTRQRWPERWAEEIPNNEVKILPRVRHFTFEGAPEATVENFKAWWKGLPIQGASSRVLKPSAS